MKGKKSRLKSAIDIIEALREAGGDAWDNIDDPEEFLGRNEVANAVAAERERCAKIAEEVYRHHRDNCPVSCRCADGAHIAARIRAGDPEGGGR